MRSPSRSGCWQSCHVPTGISNAVAPTLLGRAQADKPIHDDERVAIYVGEYGDLWARRLDEFDRSRFEGRSLCCRYRQIRDEGFDSEYDAHYENSERRTF